MSKRTNFLRSLLALSVLLLVFASDSDAAENVIRAGKWEVSFVMDIPGVAVKMAPIVTTQCVTEEDAADPSKSLPSSSKDPNCKVVDQKVEGNKVTWTVKCKGQTEVSSTGEMTFTADSYDSVIRVKAGGQELKSKIKGKRLGDCKK